MANPTQQVPTESVPFDEEKVYWPADPTKTADVTYAGEMLGMRFDTGYAEHFDDSFPKLFLGTKEMITSRFQSDTPGTDFKYLIRRPKLFQMTLASGTAAIPANIGAPAYAADSGHVQMTTSGLTNNNLAGMVVDIGRSGSTGSSTSTGILSLSTTSTPASVTVAPPTFGALVGLVCQGFLGTDQTVTATAGGNAANLLLTAGRGGNTTGTAASPGGIGGGFTLTLGGGGNATGSTTANAGAAGTLALTGAAGGNQTTAASSGNGGAGSSLTLTAGAGGNASGTTSTGNGGAGGSITLTGGVGGTTVGGTVGAPGNIKLAAGTDPACGTPTLVQAVTDTTTGNVTDAYTGAIRLTPTIAGANTITRYNYMDINNTAGAATVTDACIMRFNAAAGTHKAVDAGSTKTSPGTVTQWLKFNVNGVVAYVPSYSSKTT